MDYHTALQPDDRAEQRRMVWEWEDEAGNLAFVHDINLGFPVLFKNCHVIYSELPWKDGYEEFLRRAGQPVGIALPYEKWLYRLSVSLAHLGKPFIMVAGHAATRYLAYEWSRPVDLNGSVAMAMGAGLPPPPSGKLTAIDLLVDACSWGFVIGDPCAGFGRTARVARDEGRRFVCCDVNPRCIGTIADMMEGR